MYIHDDRAARVCTHILGCVGISYFAILIDQCRNTTVWWHPRSVLNATPAHPSAVLQLFVYYWAAY